VDEYEVIKMLSDDISKIKLPHISEKIYQKCGQKRMAQILALLLVEIILKHY